MNPQTYWCGCCTVRCSTGSEWLCSWPADQSDRKQFAQTTFLTSFDERSSVEYVHIYNVISNMVFTCSHILLKSIQKVNDSQTFLSAVFLSAAFPNAKPVRREGILV